MLYMGGLGNTFWKGINMRYLNALIITLLFMVGCSNLRPQAAREIPVTNTYHGTEVVDPYQWLEDWDNPQVRSWSDSQNRYARGGP